MNFFFRKENRITIQKEFRNIIEKGEKYFLDGITLYVHSEPNNKYPRIGFLLSHKIATAVKRNRFKRRVREIFRKKKFSLKPVDMIFSTDSKAILYSFKSLKKRLNKLWNIADVLK